MFWIIDGDAELKDDFNFDYVTTQTDTVHVWRSNQTSCLRIWRYKLSTNG